ncbi:MAG: DNA-binding transcriptional LysR family regulator [Polyangiales bacterium]|jgi:DNA-binding transcriptional LysR family regulator
MSLASFQHFLLVAEHGTFTEAAHHAHLSQPALSASIARLEEELGGRLFDRGRSGAALTAAGKALMPHAKATLTAAEDGRRSVAVLMSLNAGMVRIAAGATACTYLLPGPLAKFRKRYPKIRFTLQELTTGEALEALHEGAVDLAIVGQGLRAKSPPNSEQWMTENLVLIASPSLERDNASFLTFRRGSSTRAIFESKFPRAEIAMELGSIAAVKGHARAGIGMALVSENAVGDDIRRGRLVSVVDKRVPIRRQLRIVHRGLTRLHPAASALRDLLLENKPPPESAKHNNHP